MPNNAVTEAYKMALNSLLLCIYTLRYCAI